MPGSLSPTKRSNKWSIHICTCLSVMTFFKNRNISIEIKPSILVSVVKQRLLKAVNNKICLCYMQSYDLKIKKEIKSQVIPLCICNNCEIVLDLNCPLLQIKCFK